MISGNERADGTLPSVGMAIMWDESTIQDYSFRLAFPIFSVGWGTPGEGRAGPLTIAVEGGSAPELAVLLFQQKELAELYADQASEADPEATLHISQFKDGIELVSFLRDVQGQVVHAVWDATFRPNQLKTIPIAELIEIVER
jgi:hypothetical protein